MKFYIQAAASLTRIPQSYHRPNVRFSAPARNRLGIETTKLASDDMYGVIASRAPHPSSPDSTRRFPLAYSPASSRATSTLIPDSAGYPSDPERQRDINEEQSGAEISFAARGKGDPKSGVPFYTGKWGL